MANIEAYGTNIVGSGGSGGGGLTQEEHEWLESLAAYEPNMWDVNPNLVTGSDDPASVSIVLNYVSGTHWAIPGTNIIPVCGYKRIKINCSATYYSYIKHRFKLSDGSFTSDFAAVNGWTDWIDIPENAIALCTSSSANQYTAMYYSLSTSES